MEQVKFIMHEGIRILLIDFVTVQSKEETCEIMETAKSTLAKEPLKSVYTITLVGGWFFDRELIEEFKHYVAHNKPYVKAAAVTGIVGMKKIGFNSIMQFSGRKIKAVDTIDQAKAYIKSIDEKEKK